VLEQILPAIPESASRALQPVQINSLTPSQSSHSTTPDAATYHDAISRLNARPICQC